MSEAEMYREAANYLHEEDYSSQPPDWEKLEPLKIAAYAYADLLDAQARGEAIIVKKREDGLWPEAEYVAIRDALVEAYNGFPTGFVGLLLNRLAASQDPQ